LATATALSEGAPHGIGPGPDLDPTTDGLVCGPAVENDDSAITCGPAESTASARTAPCPANMVDVQGEYCPALEQVCEKYINEPRDRCERFRAKMRCYGHPRPHRFCIDLYEYPNQAGVYPVVGVTWDQAAEACSRQGKRLCTAEEWTLACEGPEGLPHPYGFVRDATACNIDRPYIMPNEAALDDPERRATEYARLSQSDRSGARERCVSPYGVHDMTGNVDEWVINEEGSFDGPEYDSSLKGGYWGPVRNRCRPMTTDHNHWHRGYQIGFRCCSEIQGRDSAPECVANVQTVVSPEVLSAAALAIVLSSAAGSPEPAPRPRSKPVRPTEGRVVAQPTPAAIPSEAPATPSVEAVPLVPSAADAGPEAEMDETPSSVDDADPENPY
jgi:hypothetical protein